MNPRVFRAVALTIYLAAAVAFGWLATVKFGRGDKGLGWAAAAGSVYALVQALLVIRKAVGPRPPPR